MPCSIARRASRDRPGAPDLAIGAGEIRFHRVRFGYRPGRPALRGLDLVIPAGLLGRAGRAVGRRQVDHAEPDAALLGRRLRAPC